MKYVETTTIVQTDRNGRLVRRRKTTYVRDLDSGIEMRTVSRVMTDDEYYTRKSFDNTHRSSFDRIYDAYHECKSNDIWD
jgi:hypothetical protein